MWCGGMTAMTHDVSHVRHYDFTSEDELFLDTNIWLFIFGPQSPASTRMRTYSSAFRHILNVQSHIYIDVLVLSEFINAYARRQWQLVAPGTRFKEFRNSQYFKPIAQEISDNTKRVLSHCSRIESRFEMLDVDGLMNEYAEGGTDFNDQVIRELCNSRGLKLVTDDGDFDGRGISIITANRRLLG